MITFARPSCALNKTTNAHDRFVTMLPQIKQTAQHAFRGASPEAKEELVAEVVANAFGAFMRLVERGKEDVALPTPLAWYAIRQVRAGRHFGTKLNVRDVSSRYAQLNKGILVERLDRFDRQDGEWREILVEDRHAGPADTAAARLDFGGWLRQLPPRRRKIARLLATGETTKATAKRFKVSAARISQLRQELQNSWRRFQGEPVVA